MCAGPNLPRAESHAEDRTGTLFCLLLARLDVADQLTLLVISDAVLISTHMVQQDSALWGEVRLKLADYDAHVANKIRAFGCGNKMPASALRKAINAALSELHERLCSWLLQRARGERVHISLLYLRKTARKFGAMCLALHCMHRTPDAAAHSCARLPLLGLWCTGISLVALDLEITSKYETEFDADESDKTHTHRHMFERLLPALSAAWPPSGGMPLRLMLSGANPWSAIPSAKRTYSAVAEMRGLCDLRFSRHSPGR